MSTTSSNCKICKSSSSHIFSKEILGKYIVKYFQCINCGFVQTEEPFWLEEAYRSSMNLSDTGQITRAMNSAKVLLAIIFFFFDGKKKFLDFAGGYGFLTRILRDHGLDYYWSDRYTENLLAKGFEADIIPNYYELISCFECLEHVSNPINIISDLNSASKNLLFSTNLISNPAPGPDYWWYYGFEHGQHISFYTKESFKFYCNENNLNYYTRKGYHLITSKKINQYLFKIIIDLSLIGFFNWIKIFFKSKTKDDYNFLCQKL